MASSSSIGFLGVGGHCPLPSLEPPVGGVASPSAAPIPPSARVGRQTALRTAAWASIVVVIIIAVVVIVDTWVTRMRRRWL